MWQVLHESDPLDPAVLGSNIAAARRRKSINQVELAQKIGVSRPILVAIESGRRVPPPLMLDKIADALQIQVRELVTMPETDEKVLVRFRDPLRTNEPAFSAVNALLDFGRYYRSLETQTGRIFRPRSIPPLSIQGVDDIERAAEDLANIERARLNLGDGPIADLRMVLEQDAGVLVFGLRELKHTKIAGLFAYSHDLPLVGFNMFQSDARRQRWTLAHEYGHFLTNRYDAEITYDEPRKKSRDRHEQFAEKFASHFLMPTSAVSRRFSDLVSGAKDVTVAQIVLLADQFRVSFQAMCQRLEGMARIPRNTYAYIMSQSFRPLEAERALGIRREEEQLSIYPIRYLYLLSVLSRKNLVNELDVATYLQTDAKTAQEILQPFEAADTDLIDAPLQKTH